MNGMTRRELLFSIPAFALASSALSQTAKSPIRVKTLNHIALSVADVKRSVDFYQAQGSCS
jgi:hypothetical protein